jgi:hypothetical protein
MLQATDDVWDSIQSVPNVLGLKEGNKEMGMSAQGKSAA